MVKFETSELIKCLDGLLESVECEYGNSEEDEAICEEIKNRLLELERIQRFFGIRG